MKKKQPRTTFYKDHKGNWTKSEWAPQCSNKVFFNHECQGVEGHKGVHWCFGEDGSFIYEDNKDDSTMEGGAGFIPPNHAFYRTPQEMQKERYMNYRTDSEVTDPKEINRLEARKVKPYESYDRPADPQEIEKLEKEGRLGKPLKKLGKPKTDKSTDHEE